MVQAVLQHPNMAVLLTLVRLCRREASHRPRRSSSAPWGRRLLKGNNMVPLLKANMLPLPKGNIMVPLQASHTPSKPALVSNRRIPIIPRLLNARKVNLDSLRSRTVLPVILSSNPWLDRVVPRNSRRSMVLDSRNKGITRLRDSPRAQAISLLTLPRSSKLNSRRNQGRLRFTLPNPKDRRPLALDKLPRLKCRTPVFVERLYSTLPLPLFLIMNSASAS